MRTAEYRTRHARTNAIAATLAALLAIVFTAAAATTQDARPPAGLAEVRTTGDTGPTVVLIPGLGFGAPVFDAFTAMHLKGYRVVAVTLPGFAAGNNPEPPAGSPDDPTPWLDAAELALRELIANPPEEFVGGPVFVVGHSLGGHLAMRLADLPEVAGIISIDGRPVYPASGLPEDVTGPERGRRAWTVHADAIARVDGATWREGFAQSVRTDVPARGAELAAELRRRDPAWLQHAYLELLATDARPALAESDVPVLVIAGDLAGIPGGAAGLEDVWLDRMDDARGPVEVVPIDRGGHWAFINRPRQTAEAIRGFIEGIAGP